MACKCKCERDPRIVGGLYHNGYWNMQYRVEAMDGTGEFTVLWADGRRTTHFTPWDARRDRVISQNQPAEVVR